MDELYHQLTLSTASKKCRLCGVEKPLDQFHRDRSKSDGRRNECKPCKCADVRLRKNPEKRRAWQEANREKIREQARERRRVNRDQVLAAKKRHRDKYRRELAEKQTARYWSDPERHRAIGREYARTHKDEARERHFRWRWSNIEHVREYGRAAFYRRKFDRDAETVEFVELLKNDPCSYCGMAGPSHIDHIVPVSKGGANTLDNLTAACVGCNSSKHDRSLLEFLLYSRRLAEQGETP